MSNLTPKMYVACLASYNAGKLYGRWIDADQDIDEILEEIALMLASSPIVGAEEWSIHDFEGFGAIQVNKNDDISHIVEMAQFIATHDELGAEILNHYGNNIDDAMTAMEDCYNGEYESEEKFALQLFEDCYDIPDYLAAYIDYKQVAHDLFINDYLSIEVDHKIHVFSRF